MEFPIRQANHVKETESFRLLNQYLPATWIVRYASERDYGIDCLIEPVAESGGPVRGDLFAVQLKGTERIARSTHDSSVPARFSGIDARTVNYWMNLPLPVFLCVAEIQSSSLFFTPVKAQVRGRFDELETQRSFGFDLSPNHDLSHAGGVDLLLAQYRRERAFPEFANALADLLANCGEYMNFIEEHIDRDFFMEVDTLDVVKDSRLVFNVLQVCGYAGSKVPVPSLADYFAEDRIAFPRSWAMLHEGTQTQLLRKLAPAFADAVRLGHRLVTETERAFWESTDRLLVRHASDTDGSGIADIDRRMAACA